MKNNESLSLANPHPKEVDALQKTGIVLVGVGVLILFVALGGIKLSNEGLFLSTSLITIFSGTILYAFRTYMTIPAGIKNNGVFQSSLTNKGVIGWLVGIILTGFYILLYWFPELLGKTSNGNIGIIALFDPLSQFLNGKPASEWFVYGTLYTVSILSLGIKFMFKYRHNRYQLVRTTVVIVSQLFLAYLIPEIISGLNYNDATSASGEYLGYYGTDIKNMWPLDYDFYFDWHLNALQQKAYQPLGMTYLVIGIFLSFFGMPIITYFFGKRWYCSWVCGCGGLAETAGDPFRQLSDKSMEAWRIERVLIHAIIAFVTVMTIFVLADYMSWFKFYASINVIVAIFIVAAILSGIVA